MAKAAGVSISTTSRALTDKSQLDPQTYDRVARAVRSLDYRKKARPRPAARHMTVAVIISSILDPFFCVLLHGIDGMAKTYGCNILFSDSANSTEIELKNIQRLSETPIDGAILVPSGDKSAAYALLRERGIHVVLADRTLEAEDAGWVVSNDEEGAFLATKYLVDLGHKSILYIGGTHATSTERARLAGYRRALREHGIPVRPSLTLLIHMLEHKFISSRRVVLRPTLVLRSSCRQLNKA